MPLPQQSLLTQVDAQFLKLRLLRYEKLVMIWLSLFLQIAYAASAYEQVLDLPRELPEQLKSVIEKDFKSLSSCEFKNTTPLFGEIFSLAENRKLDPQWIKQRITKVKADPRLGVDAAFGAGIRIRFSRPKCGEKTNADTITIGQTYFFGSEPERVSTLIHEARHADGCEHRKLPSNYTLSDDLPSPSRESCGGTSDGQCDESHLGAFGAQMIFLVNYARNCISDTRERQRSELRAYSLFDKILKADARKKLLSDLFPAKDAEDLRRRYGSEFDPMSALQEMNRALEMQNVDRPCPH